MRIGGCGLLALLAALLLVACGGPTASTAPTAGALAPLPTLAATPAPADLLACDETALQQHGVARVGDLAALPVGFGNLAYPVVKLPDTTPLKPFAIADTTSFAATPPLTNPTMTEIAGGYLLSICNISASASHTVLGVSARLASLTPYAGQLNTWDACDGFYSPATQQAQGEGCGGGPTDADAYLHATFAPDAAVNASARAQQTDSSGRLGSGSTQVGSLPLTIAPRHALRLNIGVTPPRAAGLYTFAFSLTLQQAPAGGDLITSPPTLFAPVAHKWTGAACQQPAMQAQIPSSATTSTSYICPAV